MELYQQQTLQEDAEDNNHWRFGVSSNSLMTRRVTAVSKSASQFQALLCYHPPRNYMNENPNHDYKLFQWLMKTLHTIKENRFSPQPTQIRLTDGIEEKFFLPLKKLGILGVQITNLNPKKKDEVLGACLEEEEGLKKKKKKKKKEVVASGSTTEGGRQPAAAWCTRPKHVASLDIFGGLTVALMILVDDAGGEWPVIAHAPWNGCNLADFVIPFFLFIVGMAIALELKGIQNRRMAINNVILRTLKLLFWGLLLQGGFSLVPNRLTYGVDIKKIRWCGILQRIALAYLVVAFVEITTRNSLTKGLLPGKFSIFKLYLWHWIVGACVLIVYLNFDIQVACNVRGKLDPPCNAVGYIDRKVLGINHMYQHPAWKRSKACTKNSPHEGPFRSDALSWCWAHFEPKGILSSVSTIPSTIIGVHFGHVLVNIKGHSSRLHHEIIMGLGLLILGIILHFTDATPINKQLYTLNYVCVTSRAATLVFSAFYISVDIWNFKYLFLPLEWIGMNAMLVYMHWIPKHIITKVWHSKRVGILLYVIFAEILFWGIVVGVLHWLSIYWKL
ncbi:hypothetical protein Pfo_002028 [Paulownia fortunei]|nr:hypothetical protein Pfo_002028 [Paulownia fortunei]